MSAKEDDLAVVKTAFENSTINIESWLKTLSVAELEGIKADAIKYDNYGSADTVIRSFALYLSSLNDIKVARGRVA